MPNISIIISTYNRPFMLKSILSCLDNQTYTDFELILLNDGSTDDQTDNICKNYCKDNKNSLYIKTEKNFNRPERGLPFADYVTGKYFTIIDDDDYIESNYLAFLADLAQKNKADIAICGSYLKIHNNLKSKFINDEQINLNKIDALKHLLKRDLYSSGAPTKLFKTSLYQAIRKEQPPKEFSKVGGDMLFMYRLFEKADRIAVHNKPLYHHIRHNSNSSRFVYGDIHWTSEVLHGYLQAYQAREHYLLERLPCLQADIIAANIGFMKSMITRINTNNLKGFDKYISYMQSYIELFS